MDKHKKIDKYNFCTYYLRQIRMKKQEIHLSSFVFIIIFVKNRDKSQ